MKREGSARAKGKREGEERTDVATRGEKKYGRLLTVSVYDVKEGRADRPLPKREGGASIEKKN